MIKNSHQYSTTKSPVIHQLLQEASRSLKKPQEASEKPQEATRSRNVRLQELCCVFPQ